MTASLQLIDISHHQKTTPSLVGLAGVFVKATEGTGYVDPMYTTHAGHVLSHGLYLGSYHFAVSTAPIDAQALWYVQHSGQAAALAIDNENRYAVINGIRKLISRKMTLAEVRALIGATKARDSLHRLVGLYMSESDYIDGHYSAAGQDFSWIAKWSIQPPMTQWDIWQYSGNPLDRDRAASKAALDRIFRVPPESDTVTPAPHFAAIVTTPTNLYNPVTRKWVYNGRNVIRVGTKLVIRGAQYVKGGQKCWPIVEGSGPYGGYYVPVAHVKVGSKVP